MELSDHIHDRIQTLLDEYLGPLGSAAIFSRRGHLVSRSNGEHATHAKHLGSLAPDVKPALAVGNDIHTVAVPGCAQCVVSVELDPEHVLFVVSDLGVALGETHRRVTRASRLLRRVFMEGGAHGSQGGAAAPAAASALLLKPRL